MEVKLLLPQKLNFQLPKLLKLRRNITIDYHFTLLYQ
nr:MAG TPA: hypothetical protein [Caudoviricetes sp.]